MANEFNPKNILAHFPPTISQGIVDFARDTVFLGSRYLFTRRVLNLQYAYCTHCREEYICGAGSVYYRHNEERICHKCESRCIVKASGRGRKRLVDDAYMVYYEKSVVDPKAIVAYGLHVVRDYSGDYRKVETQYRSVAWYLFQPGKSTMIFRDWRGKWQQRKSVRSECRTSMKNKSWYLSEKSVTAAVQGTPFQYSTWERFRYQTPDLVEFFDLAAKYPCVEYLSKMGLRNLIEAKLIGRQTHGSINWRGKTLEKVLRLSKPEIKDLRSLAAEVEVEPLTLHSYHFFRRKGLPVTFEQAYQLQGLSEGYYLKEVEKLSDYASFTAIAKYVLKQLRKEDVRKHYRSATSVLIAWRDYLKDCTELGMDTRQEHILFPNNIYSAHQKTIEKVKIKRDNTLNELIRKRLADLQRYAFEHNGLFLRPAQDSAELFREGKALNHCVGRYAKTYAEGKTNLFVIRKVDEPDVPFYTMEVIDDKIIQTRGKSNCLPTKEVEAFVQAFAKARLTKKNRKGKRKINVALPA